MISEWLKGCPSVSKIPLAYVIHEEEEVPDQANDLPGNYTTIQEELIMQAPIRTANGTYTPTFLTDRATVWEKLSGHKGARLLDLCLTYTMHLRWSPQIHWSEKPLSWS